MNGPIDPAERADMVAWLRRLRRNARVVAGNDATGADARAQALDWDHLLTLALALAGVPGTDPAAMIEHWKRLAVRLTDELRAGLHHGAAAAGDGGERGQ